MFVVCLYNCCIVFQTLTTFKDGVIIQDIAPQKAGGGKRHFSKMSVQRNELTTVGKASLTLLNPDTRYPVFEVF